MLYIMQVIYLLTIIKNEYAWNYEIYFIYITMWLDL